MPIDAVSWNCEPSMNRCGQALENSPGDLLAFAVVGAWKENREFVAAGACATAVLRGRLARCIRDSDQRLVAGKVAMEVVDSLEVIEVDQKEHAPALRPNASPSARINSRRLASPVAGSVLAFPEPGCARPHRRRARP